MLNTRIVKRTPKVAGNFTVDGCLKCACPILIIEDQKSIAQLLEALIRENYGYATVVAHSLSEAALAIETHSIHLAISDLNLPDAPYGEIIDLLTKNNISAIALTGAYGHELRETILKKGAIDYIPKQNVHSIEYAVEMVHRIYKNHHTHVLVVDDSLTSRALLKHILERLQFNVITASNGDDALSIIAERSDIQLVLVDYEMPGMNGFELIHKIRKHVSKEKLAIIGISATDEGEISAQFLKSGANDFVRKPFSYEEIVCRIAQNLEVLDLIRINREAAYKDFLTGMHNRRFFFEEGAKLHKQAVKRDGAVAAMIDVDFFKKINDTYGHDVGDVVLIELAALLNKHFSKHLVARLGGEEFSVIVTHSTMKETYTLFENFRQDVENNPANYDEGVIAYTVSIGLSDQLGETIDDFIKFADQKLYDAKSGGRNRVVCT